MTPKERSHLGPSYMVSGTRDNPPPEATLSSVYMWKGSPCRPSQSWPCMIIHNPCWIIKCAGIPRSFDHSGFCQLIFISLIQISALNLKFRHYVTLATLGVVPVRRAKSFIWRKVVPPARVTLLAEARQLAHLSCLTPRDGFMIPM